MTPADIAECERIKARIWGTTCHAELKAVQEDEIAAIVALEKQPDCAVFRIHIRNLALYMQDFVWGFDAKKQLSD